MKVTLDPGAKLPTRAHETDAGYDLYATENKLVPKFGEQIFSTGVHVQIPEGYAGLLVSKSGLNINHGITSTGLIDSGYTGPIIVKLTNHSNHSYEIKPGDKITQLVLIKITTPDLKFVNKLENTERGFNGLGSSGR